MKQVTEQTRRNLLSVGSPSKEEIHYLEVWLLPTANNIAHIDVSRYKEGWESDCDAAEYVGCFGYCDSPEEVIAEAIDRLVHKDLYTIKTMTTKEKIAIMQAFEDGKPIQSLSFGNINNTWNNETQPTWDWEHYNYRIKPEAKVRPYTFAEMCEAVKKHGVLVRFLEGMVFSIRSISCDEIEVGEDELTYEELLETGYVWLDDNSPCGVVEE